MNATFKFDLGDKVKDQISGFSGIVVGRTEWLNGCKRITVAAASMKEGKPGDNVCFDEEQLKLEKAGAFKVPRPEKAPGGPRPTPTRNPDPVR